MKTRLLTRIATATLLATLVMPALVAAQNASPKHHHYKIVDMGTFGGPASNAIPFLNNKGEMVGGSATAVPASPTTSLFGNGGFDGSVPFIFHTFIWKDGKVIDLRALPPADQNFSNPQGLSNEKGEVVGVSDNGIIDPIIGYTQIRAVVWKDRQILDLGTMGGYESAAITLNNRGQVVGFALNATPDPFSMFYLPSAAGTQTRAFLWDERSGMQDLGTLGGPDAQAGFINERGQIAGASYTNFTPNDTTGVPTLDPFLWRGGKMVDLGTLGGTVGFPNALNNRGQVVGQSNLAGDQTYHPFLWTNSEPMQDLGTLGGNNAAATAINDAGEVIGSSDLPGGQASHAFLWTKKEGITDLGTVYGDACSDPGAINSAGQIAGASRGCDYSDQEAVLWENGEAIDLNTLVPLGSPMYLTRALTINDRGEIGGLGVITGVGEPPGCFNDSVCGHAFLLIPCDEGHPDIEGCDYSLVDAKAATAAQAVRGTRDSKLSAAGQARVPLSSKGALPAAQESTQVRQLLLRWLGFARFTGSVFPVTSDPALTSGPSATLSPASLTFATQSVGTTSAAETVALKNTGTTSLTISSIAITGTDHADFTQTHTCGSSLAAGASCSISVTFSPRAPGTRTAILSVTDNAAGSPQKVSLAGIGTTARLSPSSLNFGAVGIGATSPAQIVTLTNVGTSTLTVTGIAITGTDAADFAQTHTCASSLAAYASCIIRVTFKPTALSTRAAMLSVTDNAAGSPQKVSLTGIGTTARLSPTSLYFASVPVGTTSPAQIVTLTNVGTTTLTVTGIAITGTNAADFTQTHKCASSLAAGASCSISVTFKPTATGLRNAALSVSDNAGGSPQTVSLCGGCIPQGHFCYGPGPNLNRCCRAPYPHHSYCSNPTGWGTCVSS
jgi:probable HAF family extracellular repeat protein